MSGKRAAAADVPLTSCGRVTYPAGCSLPVSDCLTSDRGLWSKQTTASPPPFWHAALNSVVASVLLLLLQAKRLHLVTMWLGIAGLGLMAVLIAKRVKGAIMIGILFTTFISWIPGHQASYLGDSSPVPGEPWQRMQSSGSFADMNNIRLFEHDNQAG